MRMPWRHHFQLSANAEQEHRAHPPDRFGKVYKMGIELLQEARIGLEGHGGNSVERSQWKSIGGESNSKLLIVRLAGKNQRYSIDQIPAASIRHLEQKLTDTAMDYAIRGVMIMMDPKSDAKAKEEAKSHFEEAQSSMPTSLTWIRFCKRPILNPFRDEAPKILSDGSSSVGP